jgi:eukaryotic-like serine/threonine-protein kinase
MDGTPALLSGTFARRYTVERELGRGASATVYLARDTQRGRAVAIKVLRPELAESLGADRFLREIKVNERLHHPHIASVLDSGEHDGRLFFVLPHMEGGSLRQLLQREKQLPIEAAIAIARTVAEALDYAHKQGLIHRDVKPENILFTSGQACLVDFGIARAIERAIDDSTTETGLVRGTPAYMSPEQASGSRNYDGKSDQYSLACVLYEMLAGVPAFIGPTPEAVIAMRFKHAPRELRVFRPTVSPALEAVIHKALSITAADRFATAGEFSQALETALRAPHIEPRPSGPSAWNTPSRKWALGGAAVFVVALAAAANILWPKDTPTDPTKYVLLPVEGDSSALVSETYDLLHQALASWQGVNIVDRFAVQEILGSDQRVSDRDASRVSRQLGAGRYVRARVTRTGQDIRAYAAVYDGLNHARITDSSITLDRTLHLSDSAFAKLARVLLLPGIDSSALGSKSVPAVQLFAAAMRAVSEFNLTVADSLLLASLQVDHDFARAAMWLAQVRTWQLEPMRTWSVWAEVAAASRTLQGKESRLTDALLAIAHGNYQQACQVYDALRGENPRDFAAWYGLGQCHHLDAIVIRDTRSPSGWRFRSSYQRAVTAYVRALELAPAVHRSFEPGAYGRLKFLLFTMRNNTRSGVAIPPDSTRFLAYASWSGDSLLFVPYPTSVFIRGGARVDQGARNAAASHQRELFARIARMWSVALPRSAGAKEAVAIALEMLGDPNAIDTIVAARALATEPLHRIRLAQQEVMLRVEFGRRDQQHLQRAFQIADSVLTANKANGGPREAEILGSLAALLGKCGTAGALAARAVNSNRAQNYGISSSVLALAESVTVVSAMGCRVPSDSSAVARVREGLPAGSGARSEQQRQALEYMLLGRGLSLAYTSDSAAITRMAVFSGDPILLAEAAALRHDLAAVRAALDRRQGWRGESGSEMSPDGAVEEARLWLVVHDTVAARTLLDNALARPRWLEFLDEPVSDAALVHAAALRAELASAADRVNARTWAHFVAALWQASDRELRPLAQRMNAIAHH